MNCTGDYSFGSVSASTFAFWFFMAISLVISLGNYSLLANPKIRRVLVREWTPLARLALWGFSVLLGLVIFLSVYFTSLDGFYRLRVRDGGIQAEYILPARIVAFPKGGIAEIRRKPTFKQRWRLIFYTAGGQRFESANAGYAEVKSAWDCLGVELPLATRGK